MNFLVSAVIVSGELRLIDFFELSNILSILELNTSLPEFRIICLPSYSLGVIGASSPDS